MAFIVDDILLGPIKFVKWIGEKLNEAAEQEMTDESAVRERLLELQMRYELDEITKEEYRKGEERLMTRLESIRKYKEEKEARRSDL
ncbi:MAG: gas vesicle protein GvpG [Planctomycetes bacterium DG_23]|nr:MAG: gas vesicle protein GvpG [Planctomycetes bacterium DG_23]